MPQTAKHKTDAMGWVGRPLANTSIEALSSQLGRFAPNISADYERASASTGLAYLGGLALYRSRNMYGRPRDQMPNRGAEHVDKPEDAARLILADSHKPPYINQLMAATLAGLRCERITGTHKRLKVIAQLADYNPDVLGKGELEREARYCGNRFDLAYQDSEPYPQAGLEFVIGHFRIDKGLPPLVDLPDLSEGTLKLPELVLFHGLAHVPSPVY